MKTKKCKKIRALALISGGLDSAIAAMLMKDHGIEVYGIHFTSPFFSGSCKSAIKISENLSIPLEIIELGSDYFKMLRNPKHGYGSVLNPCVDCHIFMLKEAKKYAKKIGAKFIITGEVLGQRPKSQNRKELEIIEKETGLSGRIVRPLSAKLLPKTEAERKGWIDPKALPCISGRSRNQQFVLARQFGIKGFSSPSGGCLLTYREFAAKVRDLFIHQKALKKRDIELLKIGRHFRFGKVKIIVGRNEDENMRLLKMKGPDDYFLEAGENIPSPITILNGEAEKKEIEIAAMLTAFYSDAKKKKVIIKYGKNKLDKSIVVKKPGREDVEKMRIVWK